METSSQLESLILRELQLEYVYLIKQRKLNIRPASVQLFESSSRWAEFDSLTYTIHISKMLILNKPWSVIVNILKHEVAHQLVFEKFKNTYTNLMSHGKEFQEACDQLAISQLYRRASVDEKNMDVSSVELYEENLETIERNPIIEKVQKLLSLAQSDNQYEAQIATLRAQELILKYNLEAALSPESKRFHHLVIHSEKQRFSLFDKKLVSLLTQFYFVQAVIIQEFSIKHKKRVLAVEVIGEYENVLMAEYVFHFLNRVSQKLYAQIAREPSQAKSNYFNILQKPKPKSRQNKDSFLLGILEGFYEKLLSQQDKAILEIINRQMQPSSKRESKEITTQNLFSQKELKKYTQNYFPQLVNVKTSTRRVEKNHFDLGRKQGQGISIEKPVQDRNRLRLGFKN